MYGIPGGHVASNEKLISAAKRELEEETGITTKSLTYIGVVREKQKDYIFIHFMFLCDEYVGSPQLMEPDKCEGWKWYDLSSLPETILPGHKAAIDLFLHESKENIQDI